MGEGANFAFFYSDCVCVLLFLLLFLFLFLSPPHHAGTNQVQVLITDENDCVPEFLQSIYSVDGVPETVTTATSLLQGEPPLTPRFTSICFSLSRREKLSKTSLLRQENNRCIWGEFRPRVRVSAYGLIILSLRRSERNWEIFYICDHIIIIILEEIRCYKDAAWVITRQCGKDLLKHEVPS